MGIDAWIAELECVPHADWTGAIERPHRSRPPREDATTERTAPFVVNTPLVSGRSAAYLAPHSVAVAQGRLCGCIPRTVLRWNGATGAPSHQAMPGETYGQRENKRQN
jgi:hypothetical protein